VVEVRADTGTTAACGDVKASHCLSKGLRLGNALATTNATSGHGRSLGNYTDVFGEGTMRTS
jgi:hypothetical protein